MISELAERSTDGRQMAWVVDKDHGDRYGILKPLGGESGFGRVYLAERQLQLPSPDETARSLVALKLIKTGMDSQEALARFETEGQLLALLHHPSIAKIYKMGELTDGRPYIAMEYVDGISLTEYCDRSALSLKQRLELFLSLCGAMQHAHQKGVIHRDLQPSNILVTNTNQGEPLLKVIDFGIAKALQETATSRETSTINAGVPLYMSPEQLEGDVDIDTRSDIYSLGAIAYELLTGTTPIGGQETVADDLLDLLEKIRTYNPTPPSQLLRTLGHEETSVAEMRSTRMTTLTKSMRGEIDWIVMKALEKDRWRRYDSVSALAADVTRYLNNEPLSITPQTWTTAYFVRKFANRHRIGVAATFVVGVLLIASTVFSTIQIGETKEAHQKLALQQMELEDEIAERRRAHHAAENLAVALRQVMESKRLRGEAGMVKEAIGEVAGGAGEVALTHATVLWQTGSPDKALEVIDRVQDVDPIERGILRGKIWEDSEEPEKAAAVWRDTLQRLPQVEKAVVQRQRARLYAHLHDTEGLQESLTPLISDSGWETIFLKTELALLEAQDAEKLGQPRSAQTTSAEVVRDLENTLREMGRRFPMALRLQLVKALRMQSSIHHDYAQWPHELGYIERDLQRAVQLLDEAERLDPANQRIWQQQAGVHHQLANAYRDHDIDRSEANLHYDKAASLLNTLSETKAKRERLMRLHRDRQENPYEYSSSTQSLEELEQAYLANPQLQNGVLQLAHALYERAEKTPHQADDLLQRANELLTAHSMTLRVLRLRCLVRTALAERRLTKVIERLSKEKQKPRAALAQSLNLLGKDHELGVPGHMIATVDFLKSVEPLLTEKQWKEIEGIMKLIGWPGREREEEPPNLDLKFLEAEQARLERAIAAPEASLDGKFAGRKALARTFSRLGTYYRNEGDWATSSSYFDRGFDLAGELIASSHDASKRFRLELDLAFDLQRFSSAYYRNNEPYSAERYSVRALDMMERLASKVPNHRKGYFLESLGVAYHHRGKGYFYETARYHLSIKRNLRQALRVRLARLYSQPWKPRWRRYLAESHHAYAHFCVHQGDLAVATEHASRAEQLARHILLSSPAQNYLGEWLSHNRLLAETFNRQNDYEKASEVLSQKLGLGKSERSVLDWARNKDRLPVMNGLYPLIDAQLLLPQAIASAGLNDFDTALESLEAFSQILAVDAERDLDQVEELVEEGLQVLVKLAEQPGLAKERLHHVRQTLTSLRS